MTPSPQSEGRRYPYFKAVTQEATRVLHSHPGIQPPVTQKTDHDLQAAFRASDWAGAVDQLVEPLFGRFETLGFITSTVDKKGPD